MHKYRLTRKGKVVITVLILLLSGTGLLSVELIAKAQRKFVDKPLQGSSPLVNGEVMEEKESSEVIIEVKDSCYQEKDGEDGKVLSVEAEKAYSYSEKKVAFLTFDDGPSKNITPQVLDVLEKYDIKATFFVVGSFANKNGDILRKTVNSGHAIGIHTYSHNYKTVYKNIESFTDELRRTERVLKEKLGEGFNTRLFRFPGGSFESYKKQYKEVLNKYGYTSMDWNVINGDGESSNLTKQKLLDRVKATSRGKQQLVVLMHDSATKQTTVDALPEIIEYLQSQGYEFGILK